MSERDHPDAVFLQAEFDIEDEVERTTASFLAGSAAEQRAPKQYAELGNALNQLARLSSCYWGCRGGDHRRENLLRRLCNYSFAALRLARLGLYDEALGMVRSVAEVANLIELFTTRPDAMERWHSQPEDVRRNEFGPQAVRKQIHATGNQPVVDDASYAALCVAGIHVIPESARQSHDAGGLVHTGGNFSPYALLMVLNELTLILSVSLKCAGHLLAMPDRIPFLNGSACKLEQMATDWLRVTNYRQWIDEIRSEASKPADGTILT